MDLRNAISTPFSPLIRATNVIFYCHFQYIQQTALGVFFNRKLKKFDMSMGEKLGEWMAIKVVLWSFVLNWV